MAALRSTIRKFVAVFRIYLKECFAYKGQSFIWVLADAQGLVLPAVWIAASGSSGLIAGMNAEAIIAYYFAAMTVAQFVVCHLIWDMAWDIKEGAFSAQLLRPIGFFAFSFARNVAWRVAKLVIFAPMLLALGLIYGGFPNVKIDLSLEFFLALFLGQMLSFYAGCCITMIVLWTLEFLAIFRMYYLPEMFLSGRLVPLGTLPGWIQTLGGVLWFKYTVAFPVEIALAKATSEQIRNGLVIQVGWLLLFVVAAKVLFHFGRRVYSGAGM